MPEIRTEDEIDSLLDYNADLDDPSGTHRVGTLKNTTRAEIRRHFGEPNGPFGKVSDHWTIRFPDGTKAGIYDYNRKNEHAADDDPRDWSIGGRSKDAVEFLQYLGLNAEVYGPAYAGA